MSDGVMTHPSHGETWHHFDRTYPNFASNPCNIKLGLYADGFTPNNLLVMEKNIPIILLERIFPLGFFDSMEHLLIHLAYKARVCGPVQYRWMCPFEREIGEFKRMVE